MLFHKEKEKPEIDKVIENAIHNLNEGDLYDSYSKDVEALEKLVKIKASLKGNRPKLDPNNVLKTVAYGAGLVLILEYEQTRVIASKAFGRLMRIL